MKRFRFLGLLVVLAAALGAVVASTTESSKQVVPVAAASVPAGASVLAVPISNAPTVEPNVEPNKDTVALAPGNIPDAKPPVQPAQGGPWACEENSTCSGNGCVPSPGNACYRMAVTPYTCCPCPGACRVVGPNNDCTGCP